MTTQKRCGILFLQLQAAVFWKVFRFVESIYDSFLSQKNNSSIFSSKPKT